MIKVPVVNCGVTPEDTAILGLTGPAYSNSPAPVDEIPIAKYVTVEELPVQDGKFNAAAKTTELVDTVKADVPLRVRLVRAYPVYVASLEVWLIVGVCRTFFAAHVRHS